MQRFKSILVVIDEKTRNRAVVERAVTLAQRNQACLTIANTVRTMPRQVSWPIVPELPEDAQESALDIIEEWPPAVGLPPKREPAASLRDSSSDWFDGVETPVTEAAVLIREQIVEQESQRLAQWIDFVRQSGVPVEGKMLYGTPFLKIIREVLRNDHDLVMSTAEGRGTLKERLFGSTTMHLLRKCPCPVWVVNPTESERHAPILAAVDLSSSDEEPYGVSSKIMELATALARRQRCELLVVHTWNVPAEQYLRSGYNVASSELDAWIRQARDRHKRRLTEFMQRCPVEDLECQSFMLKGEPGRLIPELATKLEVGLIVMGTISRIGVAGLFMGNSAERILRQVDCSVLTVKPDGFVTPVRLDG